MSKIKQTKSKAPKSKNVADVSSNNEKKKLVLEKWQTWVALISAVAVLIGALTELPKKLIEFYENLPAIEDTTEFCGRVVDTDGNAVVDAEIIVQGKKGSGMTDENGEFCFDVKGKAGNTVQVLIKISNKIRYNGRETLPGGNTIMLERVR